MVRRTTFCGLSKPKPPSLYLSLYGSVLCWCTGRERFRLPVVYFLQKSPSSWPNQRRDWTGHRDADDKRLNVVQCWCSCVFVSSSERIKFLPFASMSFTFPDFLLAACVCVYENQRPCPSLHSPKYRRCSADGAVLSQFLPLPRHSSPSDHLTTVLSSVLSPQTLSTFFQKYSRFKGQRGRAKIKWTTTSVTEFAARPLPPSVTWFRSLWRIFFLELLRSYLNFTTGERKFFLVDRCYI